MQSNKADFMEKESRIVLPEAEACRRAEDNKRWVDGYKVTVSRNKFLMTTTQKGDYN